ncbi:MAG: preprotein translocase subunit SecD, partial [Pseudohongiellaceae bacterium]
MLNKYPLWKYLLIAFIVSIGFFYAIPNLYAPDPAIQASGESSSTLVDDQTLKIMTAALDK